MVDDANKYLLTRNAKTLFDFVISRNPVVKSISEVMESTGLSVYQIRLAIEEIENRTGW